MRLLVERRYLAQDQPSGLEAALHAGGHHVAVEDPEDCSPSEERCLDGQDVVVARGRSQPLLDALRRAEAGGAVTINRSAAIAAVRDKAHMTLTLANHVPTPPTFIGAPAQLAEDVPARSFPLIVKPVLGDNCRGLRLLTSPSQLRTLHWPEPLALAQTYVPNDGFDLKIYGVGSRLWVVRKPSPFLRPAGASLAGRGAEMVPITPALHNLGRRCSGLFGLELFGVDCIETPDGPLVIEVNDFPNYTAVPSASRHLAEYVVGRAQRRHPS